MREESGLYDDGFGIVYYSNVNNKIDFIELDHMRFINLMMNRNVIVSKTRELKHSFENIV